MIEAITIALFTIVAFVAAAAVYCWAALMDLTKGEAR